MTSIESVSLTAEVDIGSELTFSQAINRGLARALEDDPRVIVMGQDVGNLGGVFRVTEGLQGRFGGERVVDTTLAESGIVGTALGLALRGYRPVCEIQFDGFVYPAFNQIVSQLAKLRARTLGQLSAPIVIRIPAGAVSGQSSTTASPTRRTSRTLRACGS